MPWRRLCVVLVQEGDDLPAGAAVIGAEGGGTGAGGDVVTGAATVILAMGAGKTAAASIDEYLSQRKK